MICVVFKNSNKITTKVIIALLAAVLLTGVGALVAVRPVVKPSTPAMYLCDNYTRQCTLDEYCARSANPECSFYPDSPESGGDYNFGWPIGFWRRTDNAVLPQALLMDFAILFCLSLALLLVVDKLSKRSTLSTSKSANKTNWTEKPKNITTASVSAVKSSSFIAPSEAAWNKTMLFVLLALIITPVSSFGILIGAGFMRLGGGLSASYLSLVAPFIVVIIPVYFGLYLLFKSIRKADPKLASRALMFVAIPFVINVLFVLLTIMIGSGDSGGLVYYGAFIIGQAIAVVMYAVVALLALVFCAKHYIRKYTKK